MDIKPGTKPFNSKYYTVPILNKETFLKDLKRLVKVGVFTMVQQSQHSAHVFIVPKKEGTVMFIK